MKADAVSLSWPSIAWAVFLAFASLTAAAEPILPAAAFRPEVPTPDALLGFPLGSRPAAPAEIERCLRAWTDGEPRARLVEIGRTHEGRPLFNLFLSSKQNLDRLERIRDGWAKVADPRGSGLNEADTLAASLPAVAWLAYSIHGDETSGADAALALAYTLLAAIDPEIDELLAELVIVIDPMMNPDGRQRFVSQLATATGSRTTRDDQARDHDGAWPFGRGNHYLFDMNRDWAFASQVETRARLAALGEWHPLLFVDAHEMGSQQTYLFYPPTEPMNPHVPASTRRWWEVFGREQAAAFDRAAWLYYNGEWAEYWFPGYSDALATFRGAIGILYEQAGVGQGEIARPEGTSLSYREAVAHHAISSLANLRTLKRNRKEIAKDFLANRRAALAADGPFARRSWAIAPGDDPTRLARFAALLQLHGLEVQELRSPWTVPANGNGNGNGNSGESASANGGTVTDALGRSRDGITLPPGTLVVPGRQPEAALAAALLSFDIRPSEALLERERRERLRNGGSLFYDITGWSLPLLWGLEAYELGADPPLSARAYRTSAGPAVAAIPEGAIALAVDGADSLAPAVAVRWLESGLAVRAASRASSFGGESLGRGSVLVTAADNRGFAGDALATAARLAAETGAAARALRSGYGAGDLADLGGPHFDLLTRPRIGLLVGPAVDTTDAGATWFVLDRELGTAPSLLDEDQASRLDLRRYNVLVLPNRRSSELPRGLAPALAAWMEGGGTLIAVGDAAAALTRESGFSRVRTLPDGLADLASYRLQLLREWMADDARVDARLLWSRTVAGGGPDVSDELPLPSTEDQRDLAQRDLWQSQFMPQGALLAARTDRDHWLSAGTTDPLPVMVQNIPIFLAKEAAAAPVRLGWAAPRRALESETGFSAVGWSVAPNDRELYLRLSGLLWPEAAQRLANAPYLTREPKGAGQLILFAGEPAFRAGAPATTRLLANAIVYGPGLGTRARIVP